MERAYQYFSASRQIVLSFSLSMIRRRLVQLSRSGASPIYVAPVPYVQHGDDLIGVVDIVNHTASSNSDPPTFSSSELLASCSANVRIESRTFR